MHKFAFLVHLRDYREDLRAVSRPLGIFPASFYKSIFSTRLFSPFIWSEVRVTAAAAQAEGYIIMIPYSGEQLINQPKQMLPVVQKAIDLAVSKGVTMIGLGALISPVTLGGKLVSNNPNAYLTNGNAFTAVMLYDRVRQFLSTNLERKPVVAIVGATGSVGSLVCAQLARSSPPVSYMLVARNKRKLTTLAVDMRKWRDDLDIKTFSDCQSLGEADLVVMATSATGNLLDAAHLKYGATMIDATQPRNTDFRMQAERPDIKVVDGGLVAMKYLQTNKIGQLGLPRGISFACLAETMLLSVSGYEGDFSIGNPTLEQADMIRKMAKNYAELGFTLAADHSFGTRCDAIANAACPEVLAGSMLSNAFS